MDLVFALTLLFIFVAALAGTFIQRRSRDRCLKDFAGYHVSMELKDGRRVWGELAVFSSGLELLYPVPHQNSDGHVETSFILLQDQLAGIQAIYRYHDELTGEGQETRLRQIRRTTRRGLVPRLWRKLRNFVNTFRDAFNQSLGVLMSQAKKSSQSTVLGTQDGRLTQIGQSLVGMVANGYEPILERYIGRRVVAEERKGDSSREHPGVLKEYTAGWLEVLDCRMRGTHRFHLASTEQLRLNRDLDFVVRIPPAREEGAPHRVEIQVRNKGHADVKLERLEREDYQLELGLIAGPGETVEFAATDLPAAAVAELPASDQPREVDLAGTAGDGAAPKSAASCPLPDVYLVVEAERDGDICLPRAVGVIRHGGERL